MHTIIPPSDLTLSPKTSFSTTDDGVPHDLLDDEDLDANFGQDSATSNEQSTPVRKKKTPSIIQLIEMVQALQEVYRPLTQEEQDLIRQWSGWGASAPAFEKTPGEKWQAISAQLRMLLGPKGYEAASAAVLTSYFTAPYISKGIWRLAECLGFSGGTVLEPACGTGQLLAHAPAAFQVSMTGIELEPFTASIARLLLPQAHIITAPLQEVALAEGEFDLVVGNVPFADIPIYDRTLPFEDKLSLHNYCIYRALAALRPGGIAILVTTHYTMDATVARARRHLGDLGLLLGAIRLPSYGHRWAKTAVITDILVLQRRYSQAEDAWKGQEWVEPTTFSRDGVTMTTSAYYANHPEQILGTVLLGRGMYRDNEILIKAPDDLEGAFEAAIQRIAEEAARYKSTYIPRLDPRQLDAQLAELRGSHLKEGCFYLLKDVGLVEIVQGHPKAVTRNVVELSALVRVRDRALALLEAERDYTKTDTELRPLRLELNRRYDAYVEQNGPIRRSTLIRRIDKETGEERITRKLPPWMYQFRTDEHYPLLLGLEIYDDETQQATRATIFSQRVNHPAVYKETADSREEAIALSLDRFGRLDFAFIANATKQSEETIAEYLGDLVYEDPETQHWEIAPTYLSGPVRRKLDIARRVLLTDPKWQRNVTALEQAQPEPIPPEDIKVLLGAPWIPANVISQFCQEIFKVKPIIARDRASGAWDVSPPEGSSALALVSSTWGTRRVNAFKLVEHLLNHRSTTVEDEDKEGKPRVNRQETMLALQKRQEIQTRFSAWIWEDLERTKDLADRYNRLYNGIVPSSFNGDHLSFPGMDAFWQTHLYPWQRDFLARMINTRSALCAYPVGSGKTKIQVAGAMTLRRMQLISKAAILVPNHLLEQITAEAKQLYPSANILMISRDDLAREKRRIFMARIATGDHDLVVMTHSAFESIDVHPDTKKAYIEDRIKDYKQVLYSIDQKNPDKAQKRQIKRIEKLVQRLQERLKEQLDVPHDAGITFEQLGVSYLIIDESHFFKNLGLPTNQEKLQVTPSQRAQDLLMKLRWLEKNNGQRPFASFFTATPISNSMVEAYVVLWYLNHVLLKEQELFHVDDFASMFIEMEAKIEVTPNGAGFRMYERPSAFINLPEFLHLFASVADIRSPDILADKRPDRLEHMVAVDPTPEVVAFVNTLVERSDDLRQGTPCFINGKEDNMLWVTTDGRKAALWLGLQGKKEAFPAKLDAIATQMATVYHRWQDKAAYLPGPYKSLQIGFCDMGTPNQQKGDQVYGELKRLLVQKGVPAQGVRFIHEAGDNDASKAALFEKCRNGKVAILLGSTAKLGTGTNIQTRCAAIHHCDAPWRPDEVEQREGRGQRPGNLYPVVEIFYYVQRRTFDAYSWQILANKAKFFNQVRSTRAVSRELSYSDDSSLTYGQVKAAATGDILLLEHANVSLSADAFTQLHASFQRARDRDTQEARQYRYVAHKQEEAIKQYCKIEQLTAQYTGDRPFMTPHRVILQQKEDRQKFIAGEVLLAVNNSYVSHKIGFWQGVPIFVKSIVDATSSSYVLMVYDPHGGREIACQASWLEKDNQWRFDQALEQFFERLAAMMRQCTEEIRSALEKAEQFEEQATTIFPQHQAWQTAVTRKEALDHYIDMAAAATSPETLQQLAVLRQHLLETAPKALTDRPQPKNTAMFVLPPRNPMVTQEEETTVSTGRIEVAQTEAREQTIEEIARTIQQSHLVGSRATVSFGNLAHIQSSKKGKKEKNACNQPQPHPNAASTKTQAAKGASTPTQPQPLPKAGVTSKAAAKGESAPLWESMMEAPPLPLPVAVLPPAMKKTKGASTSVQSQSQPKTEAPPKKAAKGENAPAQPQPKTGATSKKGAKEASVPMQPQPQPKTGAPSKKAAKGEGTSLWDLMMEEPSPPVVVPTPTPSKSTEQLTLF